MKKNLWLIFFFQNKFNDFFFQSIANVVSEEAFYKRIGLNLLIRQTNSEPLVEMTAKEFMFGYKSTLVTLGYHLMPNWIKFNKLGLIDRVRYKN